MTLNTLQPAGGDRHARARKVLVLGPSWRKVSILASASTPHHRHLTRAPCGAIVSPLQGFGPGR